MSIIGVELMGVKETLMQHGVVGVSSPAVGTSVSSSYCLLAQLLCGRCGVTRLLGVKSPHSGGVRHGSGAFAFLGTFPCDLVV